MGPKLQSSKPRELPTLESEGSTRQKITNSVIYQGPDTPAASSDDYIVVY